MWKKFDDPRPYCAVGGFAIDSEGNFPIMHRSQNVRSVRNCWSLPTGNHELDCQMSAQFNNELQEELNIVPVGETINLGWYDNISKETENWWHWVMHLMVVRVETLETLVNKEPHKHDEIRVISLPELYKMIERGDHFAPGHVNFFVQNKTAIRFAFSKLIPDKVTSVLHEL